MAKKKSSVGAPRKLVPELPGSHQFSSKPQGNAFTAQQEPLRIVYRQRFESGAAACLTLARRVTGFLGIGSGPTLRSLEAASAHKQVRAAELWPPGPSD